MIVCTTFVGLRITAQLISVAVAWTPSPHLAVQGAYVHNEAGKLVCDTGGNNAAFFMLKIATKF